LLLPSGDSGGGALESVPRVDTRVAADPRPPDPPAVQALELDPKIVLTEGDITSDRKGKDDVIVPGEINVNDPAGIPGAADDPLTNIAATAGLGRDPEGGAERSEEGAPATEDLGAAFGVADRELAGSFYGRSGAAKKNALRQGGGSEASEAAVRRGLEWLARHQAADGRWSLDGFHHPRRCTCGDRGSINNDIAGTAFGLLPFLGAGFTHKPGSRDEPNPYQKRVQSALAYLMRRQHRATGHFGGGMYSHGLATIALCEAYGLTRDPWLKRSAQLAVNYIVRAQHAGGGWRYRPGEAGDTSVVGWQVMALKSAQMAGLKVPPGTMKRAGAYLDTTMSTTDFGYGYTGKGSAPTTTAIGLLCRQYLHGWGPATPALSKGVANWLRPNPPGNLKNIYYYYYATQVMHHMGGEGWRAWNAKMLAELIKTQDKGDTPERADQKGSWSPEGDVWGGVGGRLMVTSLAVLTLEVYYRHLPLYRPTMLDK
jgi:hypothetical protein